MLNSQLVVCLLIVTNFFFPLRKSCKPIAQQYDFEHWNTPIFRNIGNLPHCFFPSHSIVAIVPEPSGSRFNGASWFGYSQFVQSFARDGRRYERHRHGLLFTLSITLFVSGELFRFKDTHKKKNNLNSI